MTENFSMNMSSLPVAICQGSSRVTNMCCCHLIVCTVFAVGAQGRLEFATDEIHRFSYARELVKLEHVP
jgi:hypothetical protein